MAKRLITDTAKALIFVSGMAFDGSAFDDTDLTEDEMRELCDVIDKICRKELLKLSKKYGDIPTTSSTDIINHMLFED